MEQRPKKPQLDSKSVRSSDGHRSSVSNGHRIKHVNIINHAKQTTYNVNDANIQHKQAYTRMLLYAYPDTLMQTHFQIYPYE